MHKGWLVFLVVVGIISTVMIIKLFMTSSFEVNYNKDITPILELSDSRRRDEMIQKKLEVPMPQAFNM